MEWRDETSLLGGVQASETQLSLEPGPGSADGEVRGILGKHDLLAPGDLLGSDSC